jgi:hypothetical protein
MKRIGFEKASLTRYALALGGGSCVPPVTKETKQ